MILHTGKGGVGTTCVAAATARSCAAAGRHTLLLAAAPGPDLAEVLELELGPEPVGAGDGLWAHQASPRAAMERHADAVRAWLGEDGRDGPGPVPGGDELAGLLALEEHQQAGAWDVIVVDCGPTAQALRLLTLPDAAAWWLDRRARPGVPGDAARAVVRRLVALVEVLREGETSSVRLVTTPERMAVAAARRTATHLALHGFALDAVVVNRIPPAAARGSRRDHEDPGAAATDFAPTPVLRAPFLEGMPGPAVLDRLGEALFAGRDPAAVLHAPAIPELVLGRDGATLRLPLPFCTRADTSLLEARDGLVLAVGEQRRRLPLPPALADYRATGARFEDDVLVVVFAPPA